MSVDLSINVGTRLGVRSEDLSAEAAEEVARLLDEVRIEVREYILVVWPVDTAASLQEWELRVSGLWLILRNPVDYVEYVHRSGETVLVWTEIQARSEELVTDALPAMQTAIAAAPPPPQQVALPIFGATDLLTSILFAAKRAAIARVPMLTRDALRAGILNRRPRPLGR